jgi:hypothetical protein
MSGKGWVPTTIELEDTMSELSGRITIVVGSSRNLGGRGRELGSH